MIDSAVTIASDTPQRIARSKQRRGRHQEPHSAIMHGDHGPHHHQDPRLPFSIATSRLKRTRAIWPFSTSTRRLETCNMLGSCVAQMMVTPSSRLRSRKIRCTSRPETKSRFAVGSSHNSLRSDGPIGQRARNCGALLLVHRTSAWDDATSDRPRPTRASSSIPRLRALHPHGLQRRMHRQHDILKSSHHRIQVVGLENIADFPATQEKASSWASS